MDCETCREKNTSVPFIVHEADMARQERTIKRLWIALVLVVLLFFGSNLAWTVYENQFEDIKIEAEQSADTGNNYAIGGDYIGDQAESNN